MTETIQLDMTWRGAASLLATVLIDGTAEGQRSARVELDRMASLADRARELAELVAAAREALRPVVEMHAADSAYVTRDDMAETLAEAFALLTGTPRA